MWIVYIGIAALTYSVANGISGNSIGAGFGTFFAILSISTVCYFFYTFAPYGVMITAINKDIDKKHIEHKNSLFSKKSINVLTYSIAFILIVLSFRITKFSSFLSENIFRNNGTFGSIIALTIGLVILLGFLYRYKTLPRSQKREFEYMDVETQAIYDEKIEEYLIDQKINPQISNITYLGGYHKKCRANIICTLKLNGNILSVYSTSFEKNLFKIHVSDILKFDYEQIEDESSNRSTFSPYYINLMYIDYIGNNQKQTLRFRLGRTIKHTVENRVHELKKNFAPIEEPTEQEEVNEEVLSNAEQEIETQTAIDGKYQSIENRLEHLKDFMDKELITAEEYASRKKEIIDEI